MSKKRSFHDWPLLAALLVGIPGLYWFIRATYAATYAPFGRDQGIFQYYAWAVHQGDLLYRDIRDVNGPLTTWVHLVFQLLGGENEHRFRILDLIVSGSVFALVGFSLPGMGRTRPTITQRSIWAFASWVLCGSAYLWYSYWDISQRETYATWFLLASVATQLLAAHPSRSNRSATILTSLAGALAVTTWFGKPTFVFFFPAQVLTLLWDTEAPIARLRRASSFLLGCTVGGLVHLALIAVLGDLRSFVQITLFEAPVLYRYIWARAISELFEQPPVQIDTAVGVSGTIVLFALIAMDKAPKRLLAIALLPIGALANVTAQRKGFWYHYQPLSIASHVVWLAILAWLAERAAEKPVYQRALTSAFAAIMGIAAAREVRSGPHADSFSSIWHQQHSASATDLEKHLTRWTEDHFRPWEMRQAAEYLQARTKKTDRIQVYGLDPYFWFLARRLSTTPYMYAYDLNVSTALAGGTGAKPDETARQRILEIQHRHAEDLADRMEKNPPAAFVFIEHAPMTQYWDDGPRDFALWCPRAATWIGEHYEETVRFGVVRVFMPLKADADQGSTERPE